MLQVLETIKLRTKINLLPVRPIDVFSQNLPEPDKMGDLNQAVELDDTLRAIIEDQYASGQRDFHGQDWSQQDLSGLDLTGCDLRDVNLFGTSLRRANLSQVDLQGVNCNGVNFRYAKLEGVICTGVAFNNCLFERAKISRSNLVGATVLNGRFLGTLWHANRIDTDRFSSNGISLNGLLDEQGIEKICQKTELKRQKLVFFMLFTILCGFLQLFNLN